MLDFGALPPEVNSARMYAGPGSGPIIAAASAWQAIASQLDSVARGYTAVIAGLQDEAWSGNASNAMADAALPYVEWMAAAAAQAEETAGQARAAGAAYESAYAATVPPALVTANRAEYAALVAGNIFGQNTTQIAATEAAYAQMWAQDASAMYGYAASSSAASRLTAFSEPPQTTTAGAQPAQAAAVAHAVGSSAASSSQSTLSQLLTALPQQLQSLASGGASTGSAAAGLGPFSSPLLNALFAFNQTLFPTVAGAAFTRTFFSGGSFKLAAERTALQENDLPKIGEGDAGARAAAAEQLVPQGVRARVLVDVARAEKIGGLSVPQTWASATPIASAFEEPEWMSNTDLGAVPASADSGPSAGAGPMVGMGPGANTRSSVSSSLRVPPRRFTMPRPPQGG
ncbi:PPE family protein [Mycobacterium sp.]|uniref:PPE family protein n=1 Tax=Mycobacterium sp. TaxID=1785 RepID=UPI0031CE751D